MTFAELLEDARVANIAYRQYDRWLAERNCSVREARKKKSCRGRTWFEKGERVLVIGQPEWRDDLGRQPQNFVRVWSRSAKSFCAVPESCLR